VTCKCYMEVLQVFIRLLYIHYNAKQAQGRRSDRGDIYSYIFIYGRVGRKGILLKVKDTATEGDFNVILL